MKTVLGVETATLWTAVGLSQGERILDQRSVCTTGGHAAGLPDLVAGLLADSGLAVRDLDAVAVSIGPGSFTGLRVGLGFAQGLALAHSLPVIPVGTLAAMASAAATEGRIACGLDARKGEVYLGIFDIEEGRVRTRLAAQVLEPAEAATRLRTGGPITRLVGDAPQRYPDLAAGLSWRPLDEGCPSGGSVARLGAMARQESRGPILPFYARASAAEASLT